ncbi:MAG: hypothetical protein K2X26_03170 [Chitinophagaceae bacterium]|nr:hypothetical protein [Chitinophagaceae bacterium]
MVFLFRDKSVINILFLLLLSMAVHTHLFFTPITILQTADDGLISICLQQFIAGLNPTILFILYQLIILLQAIRINLFLDQYRMYPQAGYTAAMAYILLTAVIKEWSVISSALIANFLLIWMLMKVARLYNQQSPKTVLFNIGFIMGLSIMAYHPIAIMVLVLLFSLGIMRAFQLQEWFVLLMGILLPFYFLIAWLYVNDAPQTFLYYLPKFYFNNKLFPIHEKLLIASSLVFVITVITGLFFWQQFNSRLVIQMRKNWSVLIVTLFIITLSPFIFRHAGITTFLMAAVPASGFVGAAFSYPKRLILPNLLFWILIAVIVLNNLELIV